MSYYVLLCTPCYLCDLGVNGHSSKKHEKSGKTARKDVVGHNSIEDLITKVECLCLNDQSTNGIVQFSIRGRSH